MQAMSVLGPSTPSTFLSEANPAPTSSWRRFPLHALWTATSAAVAIKLAGWRGGEALFVWPLSAGAGLVTGLGVWWIAYGRQRPAKVPNAVRPC
ncbi:hypothetical protein [Caulobacter sp. BK020]|uniref:hypothetical protein n=1 Tax=Caulobacter sp. BK020 TaxID=2512117 RepID=UPI00104EBCCB|nr:hypothetical protein [Caulobacter sp. BK020]TCS03895.1 hypothetical protein EV278_13215 [Caulobacter sp. BK020]